MFVQVCSALARNMSGTIHRCEPPHCKRCFELAEEFCIWTFQVAAILSNVLAFISALQVTKHHTDIILYYMNDCKYLKTVRLPPGLTLPVPFKHP